MIDRKRAGKIGDKVCGDIIDVGYFDWLHAQTGVNRPKGVEVRRKLEGLRIVAPDNQTSIQIGVAGRHPLKQGLKRSEQ